MIKNQYRENGQATLEVALLLPLLAVFLMLIIQVGLVASRHVLVANAARLGAREASVNQNISDAIIEIHKSVPDAKVKIDRPSSPGQYLHVEVSDTVESSLPIIGVLFPDITVLGKSSMRVEK